MRTQTPKGFRDFLPTEAIRRQFVLAKITEVFKKFGFDPLETPTLEYAETLKGKYGEEERLIYTFETQGKDEVALKYDQTVPLARVVAQYGPNGEQKLPMPFKRYQIQNVYRGENPQKGRYREFLQCDADIVGVSSPLADAEILAVVYEIYKNLGLDVVIKVNDRSLLKDIEPKYLASIDKLNKIGESGVIAELIERGLNEPEARALFEQVMNLKPTENLAEIIKLYKSMGYPANSVDFSPVLVRGLDYYTGLIIETVLADSPSASSLGGGGRFDKMVGKFTGVDLPAVGFAVGLERTMEAMEEAGKLNVNKTQTQALVSVFSPELMEKSLDVALRLRSGNISTEIYLDSDTRLDKQLKYADNKGIPYVVIIGPDELSKDKVTLKDLTNKTQETMSVDELAQKLSS